MFTNTYLPHVGGVARSVSTFEEELRRRGEDVHIVAPVFGDEVESTEHVLRVPAIQNFNGSDFSLRIPQPGTVSSRMQEFEPDVIHSHHPFLLGDSALRTAYGRHRPLIFTHHTMYEQYSHYVPLDSDAMKRVAIQLATEYCNLCHHVIAPSESIEELLRKRGVTVPITTIPTGIDLEFFGSGDGLKCRDRYQIAHDAIVIGHVGRLALEKNLEYLAEAVGLYLSQRPDVKFLVVGDGPASETMESILRQHVRESQIIMAGRQCGQDLADAYAAMDVFAFASQSETQGMVIAEAMAARNPVVALDGPGIREIVNDDNGILLNGDALTFEFAEALAILTQQRDSLKTQGEAARKSVTEYGVQCCTDRLSALYASMIEEFRNGHDESFTTWDHLQGRLEAEWRLIVEKASALSAAVSETEATRAVMT
jgi:glycosyltransferase involved in cell wall biosynthesis